MRPVLLVAAASLAGCSLFSDVDPPFESEPETYEDYRALRADLVEDLERVIGEAPASAPDACRVVAVGAKACGGPTGYRVYSASASDADAVEAIAAAITRLDERANDRFGLVSDCTLEARPTPVLTEGRCRAAERP